MNNISPLRYPGGKSKACKIIDEIISKEFDLKNFNKLISSFFGGGSFEFYMQNKYGYNLIVNDKFEPLMTYWKQVKENKKLLCDKLEEITEVTKEDFNNYKKLLNDVNETKLNKAIYYFIINRCSFSGSTLSGGFSKEASKKRFTKSSIDKIRNLNLSKLELFNEDIKDFLNKSDLFNEKTIIFLDPPYYLEDKSNRLYGTSGDLHRDFNHLELFELIKIKRNWILTYNNCDFIKNLYKDYKIIDNIKWNYGMNKSKKSNEIIIIST